MGPRLGSLVILGMTKKKRSWQGRAAVHKPSQKEHTEYPLKLHWPNSHRKLKEGGETIPVGQEEKDKAVSKQNE